MKDPTERTPSDVTSDPVPGRLAGFIAELRRRRVLTFTAGYIVAAWVTIEVSSVFLDAFAAPPRILQILIVVALAAAPVAMVLAWFFDLTRHGWVFTDKEDWNRQVPQRTVDHDDAVGDAVAVPVSEVASSTHTVEEGAERRLVTVLQCSLAPLEDGAGEGLHAEQFRRELPAIVGRFRSVVEDVDGYLLPGEGEMLTAYFGVTVAHEDGALRAVMCARRMLRYVEQFNSVATVPTGLRLNINAGLHCGFAIVEEAPGRRADQWVSNIGQTLKSAATLQFSAAANEVRLSHDVYAMLHERVACVSVGTLSLPGSTVPMKVYRVDGVDQSKIGDPPVFRTEMIGREREVALLEENWRSARDSQGRVMMLRGEAGMGKSRLVANLRELIEHELDARTITLQCSAYHTQSPLFPVIRQLREAVSDLAADDLPAARAEKVGAWLAAQEIENEQLTQIFVSLLTRDAQEHDSNIEPGKKRALLLQTLLRILLKDAQVRPTFVLIEDLHWADPTSLDLLGMLIEQVPSQRVMLLVTFRPSFRPPWKDFTHIHMLNVTRLNAEASQAIIRSIDKDQVISAAQVDSIIEKSDGVPLFVEELSRSVLETLSRHKTEGVEDPLTIPNTLQESLAARIQHLGAAKSLLQLGATIGREFTVTLLKAAASLDSETVIELMSELVERELVHRRGVGDETGYVFRHALIQDAAYASMLRSRRAECHLLVAQAIERDPELLAQVSDDVIAHHYGASDATPEHIQKSIDYWLAAAQAATQRSANVEADELLNSAFEQLQRLPQGESHDLIELRIQAGRIPVLVALHGYSSDRMAETSSRALALCESTKDFELRFMALFSVCVYYMVKGDHETSLEVAIKLELLDQKHGGSLTVETSMLLGLTHFFLGRFEVAAGHLRGSINAYRRDEHGGHAYRYGQDPEIIAMSYLTWVLFCLGDEAGMQQNIDRLIARARSLGHPNSLGFALAFVAWQRIFAGDFKQLDAFIEELELMSAEYGLASFAVQSQVIRALAQCRLSDQPVDAIATLERGIDAWRGIGSRCYLISWDVELARVCIGAGLLDKAQAGLDRATSALADTGEAWSECDLHRCRAQLAQARGEQTAMREALTCALDTAKRQQAWGWYGLVASEFGRELEAEELTTGRMP